MTLLIPPVCASVVKTHRVAAAAAPILTPNLTGGLISAVAGTAALKASGLVTAPVWTTLPTSMQWREMTIKL